MWALTKMLVMFTVFGLPAGLIGLVWSTIQGNVDRMYKWGQWICGAGIRAAGIRVVVLDIDNLPGTDACIILSNHVSNLDPPILISRLPGGMSILLKSGLMKIPILGTAMRMAKFVPVSRGQSREQARKNVEAAAEALRFGKHIIIYPEGTRSTDGTMLPFKKGAFFLATETKAPLVPVVLSGTGKMMPKGAIGIRPGKAVLRFLPPMWATEFATQEEFMRAVRERMEVVLASDTAAITAGTI